MTNSNYRYPPDEFDVAATGGVPVGVHRAPRSGWSSVWPFLLVAVICVVVVWGGITLLSGNNADADSTANPPPTTTSSSAEPSDDDSDDNQTEPSPEPEEPEVNLEELLAKADTAAPIRVVNASGADGSEPIGGLAGEGADALEGQGFTNLLPNDWKASPTDQTAPRENVVHYVGDRAESAAAVAAALGISQDKVEQVEGVMSGREIEVFLVVPPADPEAN